MGYDWRSEFEWSTTPTIHTHHAYKETKSSSEHAREACRKRRIADDHLVGQSERVRPQRERRGGLAQLEYRRGVDVAHQGPPAGACEAVRRKRAVCEYGTQKAQGTRHSAKVAVRKVVLCAVTSRDMFVGALFSLYNIEPIFAQTNRGAAQISIYVVYASLTPSVL